MSDFSLMPKNEKRIGNLPVGTSTLKVLGFAFLMLIVLFAANQYLGGRASEANADLQNAKAEQQQMQMKTAKIKSQIAALQSSGGSSRRNLAKSLLEARVDWQPIILSLIRAAPQGTYYSSGFSASAPSGSASTSNESPFNLPLSGTSPTRKDLEQLIKNLRRSKIAGKPAFLTVQLNSITARSDPAAGDAGTTPGVPLAPSEVTWSLTLSLPKPPALPAPGEAKKNDSSSSSGSKQQ